jgi:hypothetical protein
MSGMRPLVAFLDASVLYPALLGNLLMHLAVRDLFRCLGQTACTKNGSLRCYATGAISLPRNSHEHAG